MLGKFIRCIRWIARALRERQAYNELRRLDERTLRDIGLERGRLSGN
jgi:uncharacterized protein YjiS (DUF1127 family)